jgi:hypothetical protein
MVATTWCWMPQEAAILKPPPPHTHTHEIHLHIAIEVICRLWMAQEMRLLLDEELSLVDFLLDQIALLKEVVAHHGGVIPLIVMELLRHKQVSPPLVMSISDHQPPLLCSNR